LRHQRSLVRTPNGLAFKVTYNDGGASGGLIGYRGVCSEHIIVRNVEVDGRTWCGNPSSKCRQYCDGGRKGPRPKVEDDVCYESELLSRKPFKFWTGTYLSGQRQGEPIPIARERVSTGDIVLLWTGTDEMDELVPPGLYVYRLSVDSDGGRQESVGHVAVAY